MKYRRKYSDIDAIQFLNGDGPSTINDCSKFCGIDHFDFDNNTYDAIVRTYEGQCRCVSGTWIIKDSEGDLDLCPPALFDACYEAIKEQQ